VTAFVSMPRKDPPFPGSLTPLKVKRFLESFTVAEHGIFFSLIYATGLRINEARHPELLTDVVQPTSGRMTSKKIMKQNYLFTYFMSGC
jgi:site-specific recombinase XerD